MASIANIKLLSYCAYISYPDNGTCIDADRQASFAQVS